jgi:hypothetical protein
MSLPVAVSSGKRLSVGSPRSSSVTRTSASLTNLSRGTVNGSLDALDWESAQETARHPFLVRQEPEQTAAVSGCFSSAGPQNWEEPDAHVTRRPCRQLYWFRSRATVRQDPDFQKVGSTRPLLGSSWLIVPSLTLDIRRATITVRLGVCFRPELYRNGGSRDGTWLSHHAAPRHARGKCIPEVSQGCQV